MSSEFKFDPEQFCTNNELSEDALRQSDCIVSHCESHMASCDVMTQANAIADLQSRFFKEHQVIPLNLEIIQEIIGNSEELLPLIANEVAKNDPTPKDVASFVWDSILKPAGVNYKFVLDVIEELTNQVSVHRLLAILGM